jgi:hypothetical protein
MRPYSSVGATTSRFMPKPSTRSAFFTVMCTVAETTTRISGAPLRPSPSKSQPLRASSARRAAATQASVHALALVPKPTALSRGRSRISSTQRAATCSIAAAAGEFTADDAHWSHASTMRSAAAAAGSVAPITKPK